MLDLALITHGPDGLERVVRQGLPRVPGVRYVVSWQGDAGRAVPAEIAARDDIEVHRCALSGLSNNRNNAIDRCRAELVLLADNDVEYTPEGLLGVIDAFREYPEADLLTFRSEPADCQYPAESVRLDRRLPRGYYAKSIEIAFRRERIGNLRMSPDLGLGSGRFEGGEDEAFLMTAIRRGLECRFVPLTVGVHAGESTGTKSRPSDANLRAAGVIVRLYYPVAFVWRLPLKAWRLRRRAGFFRALRLLLSGARAVRFLNLGEKL